MQSVDIDRYCKNAIHEKLQYDTIAINMLNARSRSLNRIKVVDGLYDLAFIRLFENVPYLRRFRINGTYFITSLVRFNCTVLPIIVLNMFITATISQSRRISSSEADINCLTISLSIPCSLMGIRSYVFASTVDGHVSIARGTTRFSRATTPLESHFILQPSASTTSGTSQP